MTLKSFLYASKRSIIKINSKKQPSAQTQPSRGTWIVRELYKGEWVMPCFPEITWSTLKTMNYLGVLKEQKSEEGLKVLIKR